MDEKQIQNTAKTVILPMLNIYKYFATYANLAKFKSLQYKQSSQFLNPMDAWLAYRIELFKAAVSVNYENYNLTAVCQEIKDYINDISTWYLHNSRHIFSKNTTALSQISISVISMFT